MSTYAYDAVLNAPDHQTRKEALDKLCKEKIVDGMRKARIIAMNLKEHFAHADRNKWSEMTPSREEGAEEVEDAIRQAAKDLEDS